MAEEDSGLKTIRYIRDDSRTSLCASFCAPATGQAPEKRSYRLHIRLQAQTSLRGQTLCHHGDRPSLWRNLSSEYNRKGLKRSSSLLSLFRSRTSANLCPGSHSLTALLKLETTPLLQELLRCRHQDWRDVLVEQGWAIMRVLRAQPSKGPPKEALETIEEASGGKSCDQQELVATQKPSTTGKFIY